MSELAKVVYDLKQCNIRFPPAVDAGFAAAAQARVAGANGPLVDATFVYETHTATNRQIALYEDHPSIKPPWENAFVGYTNEHGNANVTWVQALDWNDAWAWEPAEGNTLDGARWCLWLWTFVGGRARGDTKSIPTIGPIALSQIAVADDGRPLDIHWVSIDGTTQWSE